MDTTTTTKKSSSSPKYIAHRQKQFCLHTRPHKKAACKVCKCCSACEAPPFCTVVHKNQKAKPMTAAPAPGSGRETTKRTTPAAVAAGNHDSESPPRPSKKARRGLAPETGPKTNAAGAGTNFEDALACLRKMSPEKQAHELVAWLNRTMDRLAGGDPERSDAIREEFFHRWTMDALQRGMAFI